LHLLMKKVMEIIDEDDYLNGYVKHLFNDENTDLEIFILSVKEKLVRAKYCFDTKTVQITILNTADIESFELTGGPDNDTELRITFANGATVRLNSKENFDAEHKNYVTDFAKSLYNEKTQGMPKPCVFSFFDKKLDQHHFINRPFRPFDHTAGAGRPHVGKTGV